MQGLVTAQRFPADSFTRLHYEDGNHEDFKSIRGSIVWPNEEIFGVALVGGLEIESEVLKILEEREFRTLSEAEHLIDGFAEKYLFWCLYYRDVPESESWLGFLNRRFDSHWHFARWRMQPSPNSEHIDFCIHLINEALQADRLIVPKDGLLDRQLQQGWQNVVSEPKLHGIVALAVLLSGFLSDPEGRGTGLLSESEFEKLYLT